MTKTVAIQTELAALESEMQALSFYRTRANETAQKCREYCGIYNLASVLRKHPGKLEEAISAQLAESFGMTPGVGPVKGYWVPMGALARDLWVNGGTGLGTETVMNEVSRDLVPYLRNRSRVVEAGATTLEGLRANLQIPRQTATATPAWLAEETQAVPSALSVEISGTLSPKKAHVITGFSNQLLQQSSLNISQVVTVDLMDAIATAIDLAALVGTGSASNQPLGLFNISGVPTVTFSGKATNAKVIGFETLSENANVESSQTSAWLLSPDTKAAWRQILAAPSTSDTIFSEDNMVCGYRALSTRQLATGTHANKCAFGRWDQMILGLFGAVSILVDRYSLVHLNQALIHCDLLVDVVLKQKTAFVISGDAANQ
jgi:HK97 family phage major capsid protein